MNKTINQYSLKIYNFINELNKKFKFNFTGSINISDPFILKINKIISKVLGEKIEYKIDKPNYLPKISNDSTYPLLYIFLKKYISESTNPKIPNPHFFSNNDLSFKNFLQYYLQYSTSINFDIIRKDIESNKELLSSYDELFNQKTERKTLHEILYGNPFVSLDVTHYAEITDMYNYKINSDDYDVELFVDSTFLKSIDKQILKILTILTIMKKISDEFNLNSKRIVIRLVLSKQKKTLFSNYEILGPINVNSGSTLPGEYINIWRFEEFEKVMIHEILHYYHCDFHSSNPHYDLIADVIQKNFDIVGDDKVNESYNETMAHIISMVYFSNVYRVPLKLVYHYEFYFLLFQTAKIINFYEGNNYLSIFKSTKSHIIFNQRTSVLSYYIIKTLFMYNIKYTTVFISRIKMRCNDIKSIDLLSRFIEIIIKDKTIKQYINPLIDIIKKDKTNKFIYKTMRMTGILG